MEALPWIHKKGTIIPKHEHITSNMKIKKLTSEVKSIFFPKALTVKKMVLHILHLLVNSSEVDPFFVRIDRTFPPIINEGTIILVISRCRGTYSQPSMLRGSI